MMTSNTNLNTWTTDPEEEGKEEVGLTPVKKKRTRRNRAQIDADDAAIALGFKDAKDQAASRPQMKGATELTTPAEVPELTTDDAPIAPIIDLRKVHDLTPGREMTGLTEGTHWNLGGRAFVLAEVLACGNLTFRPA